MDNYKILIIFAILILGISIFYKVVMRDSSVSEGFECGDIKIRQLGYKEGLPKEYRRVKRCYGPIKNTSRLDSLLFEKRLPHIAAARFSYNDTPIPCGMPEYRVEDIKDYAFLRDLPKELRNRYYATVTKQKADSDAYYQPDDTNLAYKDVHKIDSCDCVNHRQPQGILNLGNIRGEDYFVAKDPIYYAAEGTKDNYSDNKPYY